MFCRSKQQVYKNRRALCLRTGIIWQTACISYRLAAVAYTFYYLCSIDQFAGNLPDCFFRLVFIAIIPYHQYFNHHHYSCFHQSYRCKKFNKGNNFFTIAKLLPLLLFVIVGFFYTEPANFEIKQTPGFSSFTSTVLLLIFAFGGFESVLVTTGEVKNPAKNLPFALLLAALFIAVIYILIQIVSIGTLPNLATSEKPLAEAAGLFMGKTGATIIAIGALFSVTGTLNAIMLVGSRLPFAFSEEKQFPQIFSFIHPKYKTPTWSLVLFAAVTILISISNTFIYAATISAITRVMTYAIVCISLIVLRKKITSQTGFFKIPFGKFFAITGILITIWLLTSSKLTALKDITIALAAGLLIYILNELQKKIKAKKELKRNV